jgi:hypothetical protein
VMQAQYTDVSGNDQAQVDSIAVTVYYACP